MENEAGENVTWKNYYATCFENSADSCFYALDRWNALFQKTEAFARSLHRSTLDKSVIYAVSSTLAVLKSPTVLRLEGRQHHTLDRELFGPSA